MKRLRLKTLVKDTLFKSASLNGSYRVLNQFLNFTLVVQIDDCTPYTEPFEKAKLIPNSFEVVIVGFNDASKIIDTKDLDFTSSDL